MSPKKASETLKVATYYRYSSDKWMQKEHSEERQKDKCLGFVKQKRWHLVGEFSDKETSGDDLKPGLLKLKELLASGKKVDVLVVDDLSRLTRKGQLDVHEDLNWLRHAGVKLSIVRDGGGLVDLNDTDTVFKLSFDVWKNHKYLKDLAQSVADGQRALFKQKKLGWIGKAPLGFDLVKRLREDGPSYLVANDDLKYVKEIFQRFLAGETIRSLALILEKTARHSKTQSNDVKDPSAQSVKNLLRNSIYCGIRCIGVRSVGKHANVAGRKQRFFYNVNPLKYAAEVWEVEGLEKAVSVEDFRKVQAMLDANKESHRGRPASAGHRYSSYLLCASCGGHMVADFYKDKKTGLKRTYYRCAAANQVGRKCRDEKPYNKQVYEHELDAMVQHFFSDFIRNPNVHIRFVSSLIEDLKKRNLADDSSSSQHLNELDLLEQRLEGAWMFFESQGFSSKDTLERIQRYQEEIEKKKEAIVKRTIRKDGILDYAEKQYLAGKHAKGTQKYLGCCYKVAADVVAGKINWENHDAQKKAVENAWVEGLFSLGQKVVLFEYPNGDTALVPADADEVFNQLKFMNLQHIKLHFTLGAFRGRPKRLVSALEFIFLDGDIKHIGIHCCVITNQILRISVSDTGLKAKFRWFNGSLG